MGISASITVTLGDSTSDTAKAEVCESTVVAGGKAHIKLYIPLGYKVNKILNTMQGVNGCKVSPLGKTISVEQTDELTFTDKELEQNLNFYPDNSTVPIIRWIGNSLGEVSISGNKAVLNMARTDVCAAKNADDNLVSARGIVRISYKTIATMYVLDTPPLSALAAYGNAPYPLAIEFQLEKI